MSDTMLRALRAWDEATRAELARRDRVHELMLRAASEVAPHGPWEADHPSTIRAPLAGGGEVSLDAMPWLEGMRWSARIWTPCLSLSPVHHGDTAADALRAAIATRRESVGDEVADEVAGWMEAP